MHKTVYAKLLKTQAIHQSQEELGHVHWKWRPLLPIPVFVRISYYYIFLNLSETFVVKEDVTAFQKVMLKGKPVKQLNDSNLNQSRRGTGPFRIRSLLIYLKQVFLQPLQLFSQDVFIQKWRYQNTFLSCEQSSVHGFPFPLRGHHSLGCPQGKDNQMWSSVVTFPSYTADIANSDHVVVIRVGGTAGSTTRSSAQDQI